MKLDISSADGKIVVGNSKMTPREATAFIKEIQKAINEVRRDHCRSGHKLTPKNCLTTIKNGYLLRRCRMCQKIQWATYYDENKVQKREYARKASLKRYHDMKASYACTPAE